MRSSKATLELKLYLSIAINFYKVSNSLISQNLYELATNPCLITIIDIKNGK